MLLACYLLDFVGNVTYSLAVCVPGDLSLAVLIGKDYPLSLVGSIRTCIICSGCANKNLKEQQDRPLFWHKRSS